MNDFEKLNHHVMLCETSGAKVALGGNGRAVEHQDDIG